MKQRLFAGMVLALALAACGRPAVSTKTTSATTAPAFVAAPTWTPLAVTYRGRALSIPMPAGLRPAPPAAWLVIGDKAILGTYGSFCVRDGCVDTALPPQAPDFAAVGLAAGTLMTVIVAVESVTDVQASVVAWLESSHPGTGRQQLKAAGERAGDVMVFALGEPGEIDDRLFEVEAWGTWGSASYFWRLNPRSDPRPSPDTERPTRARRLVSTTKGGRFE